MIDFIKEIIYNNYRFYIAKCGKAAIIHQVGMAALNI